MNKTARKHKYSTAVIASTVFVVIIIFITILPAVLTAFNLLREVMEMKSLASIHILESHVHLI